MIIYKVKIHTWTKEKCEDFIYWFATKEGAIKCAERSNEVYKYGYNTITNQAGYAISIFEYEPDQKGQFQLKECIAVY